MEITITIVAIMITLLTLILLMITINKTSYQMLLVKIEESEKNIIFFQNKKEELLTNIINEIINLNKKKYSKKSILDEMIKNKNLKNNTYEKDLILKNALKELYDLLDDDEELLKNETIKTIYTEIKNTETDLIASKKYFNKNVSEIDKLFSTFPKKYMRNILKYKKLEKHNTKKDEKFEILNNK